MVKGASLPALYDIQTLSKDDIPQGNLLIRGDNVAVLGQLKQSHEGRIRCAYIDPPYNNQERYTHYQDSRRHEDWLRDVVRCVERIKPLLRADGSLWVSIDDREMHYLKVALDTVFGRENFVSTVVWQQRTTRENRKVFSNNHEYILVYAREAEAFKENRGFLDWDDNTLQRYRNPDNDPRGPWQSVSANVQAGHATASQFYEIVAPKGRRHTPPKGRCWVYGQARMQREIENGNVWFGARGDLVPRLKRFLSDARRGLTPHTLWNAQEVGTNEQAKKHLIELFPDKPLFDTPKPESLIHRILKIASDPSDFVLDAYLGSGTTAAVAHKMGRRYIGIEQSDLAMALCADRLRKVADGEQGGISKSTQWKGGGGFDLCRMVEKSYSRYAA
jgi:adenine-specific DNA-methyltransferase